MKYISKSLSQTTKIAKELAKKYTNRGGIITLQGPLGAGKTTFTQSFAKSLGVVDRITSPTFIISRQYPIPNSPYTLHHLDLYRLDSSTDLHSLSLDELVSDPNNLILIEWPEKLAQKLPKTTQINFNLINTYTREITISNDI